LSRKKREGKRGGEIRAEGGGNDLFSEKERPRTQMYGPGSKMKKKEVFCFLGKKREGIFGDEESRGTKGKGMNSYDQRGGGNC